MTNEIRDRLRKVYELVNRGGTEGEKQAAKLALDRLMKKYNLSEEALNDITKRRCTFKWSTSMEIKLMIQLTIVMLKLDDSTKFIKRRGAVKELIIMLDYADYVTLECAYEYFRRHMKKEWSRLAAGELARCRKAKTRNKKRTELQEVFFNQYCVVSRLFDESQVVHKRFDELTEAEKRQYMLVRNVEGGQYNRQVVTAHQLGEGKTTPAKASVESAGQLQMF